MGDEEAGDAAHSPLALDLGDLAAAVRSRRWSAAAVTEAALERIAQLDAGLHAFCTLDADAARVQAARIDARLAAGEDCGPLAGVPVAVKDLICTAGLRTTFGSRLYADHVPEEDDVVVERLRDAGAVVIGKTNTSEFGYGAVGHNPLFPTTRNPWNAALTPGGSSAGSAAAVAARMVPLALGSDGGGSVRIPAVARAACSASSPRGAAFRCTRDVATSASPASRAGNRSSTSARSPAPRPTPHWRSRCWPGRRRATATRCRPRSADWRVPGWNRCAGGASPSASTWAMPRSTPRWRPPSQAAALRLQEALGATLVASLPGHRRHPADVRGAGRSRHRPRRAEGIGGATRCRPDRLARAASSSAAGPADEFTAATMARKRIVNTTWRFMEEHEFLLTPTTAAPAFPVDLTGLSSSTGGPSRPRPGSPSPRSPTSPACPRPRCPSA